MASFSPSPVPRRSMRHRPFQNSPPHRLHHPISRLATPSRATPFGNDSIVSAMEVDSVVSDRSLLQRPTADTLFAKSNELTISFYAALPAEVKQILKNADFFAEAYTGAIDTETGFALVASVQTCFVWQHVQALKGIPTCYIFACPQDENSSTPPFHGLVPYTSAREPGLMLVSVSGEIRFWDSIGIGLAGGQNYSTNQLEMADDDEVTNLIRADPQTYILSTSSGLLFRLVLTSTGGKHHLTLHAFSRPATGLSLSRLIPFFSPASLHSNRINPELGNINSIVLGGPTPTGGRELWALVETRVQRWEIRPEGWEEPLLDQDISTISRAALRQSLANVEDDDARLDLEFVDLTVDHEGKLTVLVSFAGIEETELMSVEARRIYALLQLSHLGEVFKVDAVRDVPYQTTSGSGAPMHPRVQVLLDGQLISVQFGDAVTLCSRDSQYSDRIELKSTSDRTLGVGVIHNESSLLIMTAATMIKAQVNMEAIQDFNSETGRSSLIKSIMTQAIVYGSIPDNPLQFSFPPAIDAESLMQGAEQLSAEVLRSDPQVVRSNADLGAQLTTRKERLSWLIHFINDNAVLGKMSQRSRQRLATDSEKLYAGYQLWMQHNEVIASESVFNEVIELYMESIGEGHHEDLVRAFFRLRVSDLGVVLSQISDVTAKLAQNSGRDIRELIPEANRVISTALRSATEYREYNLGVYGIAPPMIDAWTSQPVLIDVLLALFETSTRILDTTPQADSALPHQSYLTGQLPELATMLFRCIQERLDWLARQQAVVSPAKLLGMIVIRLSSSTDSAPSGPIFLKLFSGKHGHAAAALTLAEKYRDFSSLVALCHQEDVYPPHKNPNALKIQTYIEKFDEEFTNELYKWYIQHGELRVLFSQDATHNVYIDKFFATEQQHAISWIHNLEQRRYEEAAVALLTESDATAQLNTKHLMLSIGKLAHLAHLQERSQFEEDDLLDSFHNDLDFVSVHQAIMDEFRPVIESLRGRQSLDAQIEAIVKNEASRLSEQKSMTLIFKDLVHQLLQGKSLTMEDMVDLLTLKDNLTTLGDYTTALHLLARAQNLPEARRSSAFRSVWRRIYIHDDWDTIRRTSNVSDHELTERLRSTALFATLCVVLALDNPPEGYDTDPDMALVTPTEAEIMSRWPGLSSEQVETLLQDYALECDKLGEFDLKDAYERVRELAAREIVGNVH
ncbi:Methyltransferase type 11 [Mycena indigotica]|uniref:Methyltransferase type 11 n=1 Tax=Mycena indigotica TaxID=2126181 RepID=A0A8H6S8F3_9AGAR|nr:Methyltransferase type 11 [Mycena indigotica]KAF7294905.1 Methyltransferase type 11 [Mycena indigotica]